MKVLEGGIAAKLLAMKERCANSNWIEEAVLLTPSEMGDAIEKVFAVLTEAAAIADDLVQPDGTGDTLALARIVEAFIAIGVNPCREGEPTL